MARVPYIEKSDAAPEALEVYEELEAMGGRVLNPFKMLAHSPKLLRDWWTMMKTLFADLELDPKLRELVLLKLFKITGCEYCFNEHDRIARRDGVSKEQIANIEAYATHPAFTEIERLVLRYTDSVTAENRVDDADFEKLREHFSDRQIVELTFCIGNWTGLSHFIVPIGLELEAPAPK
jgi:AhpD family alkylhydroperoxidase